MTLRVGMTDGSLPREQWTDDSVPLLIVGENGWKRDISFAVANFMSYFAHPGGIMTDLRMTAYLLGVGMTVGSKGSDDLRTTFILLMYAKHNNTNSIIKFTRNNMFDHVGLGRLQ